MWMCAQVRCELVHREFALHCMYASKERVGAIPDGKFTSLRIRKRIFILYYKIIRTACTYACLSCLIRPGYITGSSDVHATVIERDIANIKYLHVYIENENEVMLIWK